MYHLDFSSSATVRGNPYQGTEQDGSQDKDYVEPLDGRPHKYQPERNAHNTDVGDDVAKDAQGDSYAMTPTAEPQVYVITPSMARVNRFWQFLRWGTRDEKVALAGSIYESVNSNGDSDEKRCHNKELNSLEGHEMIFLWG